MEKICPGSYFKWRLIGEGCTCVCSFGGVLATGGVVLDSASDGVSAIAYVSESMAFLKSNKMGSQDVAIGNLCSPLLSSVCNAALSA